MSFLSDNASAIFGVAGVLLGGVLTYAAGWRLRKRDYDLRMWDRLMERRIAAHEGVLSAALELRVMNVIGGRDEQGELRRAPLVLASREDFEDWFARVALVANAGSPWLSTEATREVNFMQDYVLTLHENARSVPSELFPELGVIVRQDFIDLSDSLERAAHSFFRRDIRSLTLRDADEWHKYPREETERRLNATRLMTEWSRVANLCEQGSCSNAS